MNRTIKEAAVKRYYYDSYAQLKDHLNTFVMPSNFARRLKTLRVCHPMSTFAKSGEMSGIVLLLILSNTSWE